MSVPDPTQGQINIDGPVLIEVGPSGQAPQAILQLPANPDEDVTYDLRVTLIQTVTGAYTDDYGLGIPRLVLSGTTAWMSPRGRFNGSPVNGPQAARHLYVDILQRYFGLETGHTSPTGAEMLIHDEAQSRSWRVKPIQNMRVQQSKANPLIKLYTLNLIVEADLTDGPQPVVQQASDPVAKILYLSPPAPSLSSLSRSYPTPSATPPPQTPPAKAAVSAATKTVAQRQTPLRTYVVQSGDTLWGIAQADLGNGALYPEIIAASRQIGTHIKSPHWIFPGQTLVIPTGG